MGAKNGGKIWVSFYGHPKIQLFGVGGKDKKYSNTIAKLR
jgi:hypothetical protein